MNLYKKISDKIKKILSRKKTETKKIQNNVINEQLELDKQMNKLNSRISLMAQKIEEMQKQQEQTLMFVEQILYHASGSFEENSNNPSRARESDNKENFVNKFPYKLN